MVKVFRPVIAYNVIAYNNIFINTFYLGMFCSTMKIQTYYIISMIFHNFSIFLAPPTTPSPPVSKRITDLVTTGRIVSLTSSTQVGTTVLATTPGTGTVLSFKVARHTSVSESCTVSNHGWCQTLFQFHWSYQTST